MFYLKNIFASLGVIATGLIVFTAASHEGTITEATDIVYSEWQTSCMHRKVA